MAIFARHRATALSRVGRSAPRPKCREEMPSGTTTLGRGKCEQFSLVTFAPQQPMRVLKIAEWKICTTDINRPYAKPNVHKSNGNPRFDHLALLDAPATACSALSIALLPLSDHQHPHHHRHHHHHRRRHPHRCCRRRRRILPAVFVSIVTDINIIVLIPSSSTSSSSSSSTSSSPSSSL